MPLGTPLSSPSLFVESLTVRFRMDTVNPTATSLDRLTLRVGLQADSHDHWVASRRGSVCRVLHSNSNVARKSCAKKARFAFVNLLTGCPVLAWA